MNINFVCVARTRRARSLLPRLYEAAVADAQMIFGKAVDHRHVTSNVALFNADRMSGTWSVPTWDRKGDDIIAVSQPPIPVDDDVSVSDYWPKVRSLVHHKSFNRLLPNHFGIHHLPDGSLRIWSDRLGFGRCYYVITDHFVAASNHIGILTHFIDGPVTLNTEAVSRYAHLAWYPSDDTPITGVRRLREAEIIEVSPSGALNIDEYADLAELVAERDSVPDYDFVVDQCRVISRNIETLSVRTPTVFLSGGRDSRMTASIWLSGGSPARVVTLGTLTREVEIANELLQVLADSGKLSSRVSHDVRVPKAAEVTIPLDKRLATAFSMWDGDASPTTISRNLRVPDGRGALSIGGVGGEIMHGMFYGSEGDADRIASLAHPVMYAARRYQGRLLTEDANFSMQGFFDGVYERASRDGLTGLPTLDYFYLTEKLRRWGNQALGSKDVVMLSAPAFVRAAFDASPEVKMNKRFPGEIVRRAIPEWDGIEYYKASVDDSKASMKRKILTYKTDPDYFFTTLREPRHWDNYFERAKIEEFVRLVRAEQAMPVHEAMLNRVIWIDYLDGHVETLNRRKREVNEA